MSSSDEKVRFVGLQDSLLQSDVITIKNISFSHNDGAIFLQWILAFMSESHMRFWFYT